MFDTLTIKDIQVHLGKWCQALRKNENLTQGELAGELALSRLTISKLERGKNFTIATLLKVLHYFGELQSLNEFVEKKTDRPEPLY